MRRLATAARLAHTTLMVLWLSFCCCGVQSLLGSGLRATLADGRSLLPPCCAADLAERMAAEGRSPADPAPIPSPDHRCGCRALIETGLATEQPLPAFDTVGTAALWPAPLVELLATTAHQPTTRCAATLPASPPPTLLRLHCALTI